MNLDLQRAALVDPVALRVRVAQIVAARESESGLAFFILRIGFPVDRCVRAITFLLRDLREDRFGISPPAVIDGASPVGVLSVLIRLGSLVGGGPAGDVCRDNIVNGERP